MVCLIWFSFAAHRDCWFSEYKCDNGQCIQAYAVCNGQSDCVDGSDEKQCHEQGTRNISKNYVKNERNCHLSLNLFSAIMSTQLLFFTYIYI